MALIPIPQEGAFKKFSKLALKEVKRDKKIVGDTCTRMVQYVEENGEMGLEEMKKLIHGMERSVIKLHKEKKKIVELEMKKLKRRKPAPKKK